MASKKGLGKGMGALLGDFEEITQEKTAYQLLPIYKVEPNPDQPRQDFDEEELQALADSITEHGIIQPLTVRELNSGYYQIIAGEVEEMWPKLRLVVDMGQPLSEVEKWDLDDIRYFNSILDMRRDCEAAADAYQAMQMEQMRQANERRY